MHECKECQHDDLRYCKHCKRVYCEKCGKEWVEETVCVYSTTTFTPDGTQWSYTDGGVLCSHD